MGKCCDDLTPDSLLSISVSDRTTCTFQELSPKCGHSGH